MVLTLWVGGRQRVKSWTGGRLAFGRTMHGEHEMPKRGWRAALFLKDAFPCRPLRSHLVVPFLLTVALLYYLAPINVF